MAKFKSKEEYLGWCERQVVTLHYAQVAGNSNKIKELMKEIGDMFSLKEGEVFFDDETEQLPL